MMEHLPFIFLCLMALSMLIYVLLDGYDLGVGMLMAWADDDQRDSMIASIGPFWDANETWLVLGVGILLVAFPVAHGVILQALYLPVALMLIGLILRGVAFDFRVKARAHHQANWNRAFVAGSLSAAVAQGVMLGRFITGFGDGWQYWTFALFIGICLAAGYCLLGAGWLIMKTTDELQKKAVHWARRSLLVTALGVAGVSAATPLVSDRISERWFASPQWIFLAPVPLLTLCLFIYCYVMTRKLPLAGDRRCWVPFVCGVGIFVLAFIGLTYSLYPYLVVDQITYLAAASAPESLLIILVGTGFTLPAIAAYTVYAYRVFWGKSTKLSYD